MKQSKLLINRCHDSAWQYTISYVGYKFEMRNSLQATGL